MENADGVGESIVLGDVTVPDADGSDAMTLWPATALAGLTGGTLALRWTGDDGDK